MKKICFGTSGTHEKDMLWNGWQGVKRGSIRAAHTYTCHYMLSAPPPPVGAMIIGKASKICIFPGNDNLHLSSPASISGSIRRIRAAPAPGAPGAAVSGVEGYVVLYAARCLDFLLPILEFLRLIIQHHIVLNRGRISSLILTTSVRRLLLMIQGEKAVTIL